MEIILIIALPIAFLLGLIFGLIAGYDLAQKIDRVIHNVLKKCEEERSA